MYYQRYEIGCIVFADPVTLLFKSKINITCLSVVRILNTWKALIL